MPTNLNTNKLKSLTRHQRLSVTEKKVIQTAANDIAKLEAEVQALKEFKNGFSTDAKLKAQPKVKLLIEKELIRERRTTVTKTEAFKRELKLKDTKLREYEAIINATKTKAVKNKDFNSFISNSVQELQASFDQSTSNSEIDILIRDVEIEASVMVETQNNKPVFIIPSRIDMKELGSENFQKLKYSLSIVPKDI